MKERLTTSLKRLYQLAPSSLDDIVVNSQLFRFVGDRVVDFDEVTITVDGTEFDMYAPAMNDRLWIEHDPYREEICHEPPSSRRFVEMVDDGDVVWDLGSKFGYFSAIAAQLTSPEKVHVFEPSPIKVWLIERMNAELFDGDITVVDKPVMDVPETGVTGDEYLMENGPPDFVKMDIEGAEAAALKGMGRVLEEYSPTVLLEVHPNKLHFAFDSTDEYVIEVLQTYYDNIEVCPNFRDHSGKWLTDSQNVTKGLHDLGGHKYGDRKDLKTPIGYIDWDAYHVIAY